MKKIFTFFVCLFVAQQSLNAQCGNVGTLAAGSLTPPGVGMSTSLLYNSGQYVLAYVNAGASYNVSTCGGSSGGGTSYDTQLVVYEDATGTLLAYNDDYCGLESNAGFTAPRCGYVRVLLMQYYCNASNLPQIVTMTQNTAGNTPVSAAVTHTNVLGCAGNATGAASIMASGGSGPYTYSWSPVGGNTATVSNLSAGTYTYYITDSLGCSPLPASSNTVQITEPPVLTVTATASSPTVCSGSVASFSANANGGSGAYTYTWSTGSAASTATASPVNSSSYTVTVQDANLCSASATASVATIALPVVGASVSPSAMICAGDPVTLSGSGANTYTWTGGAVNGVAFAPTLSSYTVTGTDVNGCTNTAVQGLMINALPMVGTSASPSAMICAGDNVTLSGSGASTYTWTGGISDGVAFIPSLTSYTVTGTDANGCVNTAIQSITINALPVVSAIVSPTDVICAGDLVTLSGSGASTYTWTGGATDGAAFAPALTSYTVTGTDANGCMNTAVQSLTINALPMVSAIVSPTDVICAGDLVTLSGSGAGTYSWTGGATDGVAFAPALSSYTVTGTDANGCVNTAVQSLTINALPVVGASASPSDVICAGDLVTLSGSGASTYTWTGSISNGVAFTPSLTSYTVTGTDANGCVNSAVQSLTINALPAVNASSSSTLICNGNTATLTASGATSYTWSTSQTTASVPVSPSTNTTYTVTGTDGNGCSNTATVTQNVSACTGIEIYTAGAPSLLVYPNPNNGAFTIKGSTGLQLQIVNELGQPVLNITLNSLNNYEASVSSLSQGIYFIIGLDGYAASRQKIIVSQ